jgi:hypothetical protein
MILFEKQIIRSSQFFIFGFQPASENFGIGGESSQITNFNTLGGQATLIAVRRVMPSNLCPLCPHELTPNATPAVRLLPKIAHRAIY